MRNDIDFIEITFLPEYYEEKGRVDMIGGDLYNYMNVLNKAADASWARLEVINNNLANVSTPNYKRKDVEFESYLSRELAGSGSLNSRVDDANTNQLDYSIYTDNANLSYRKDGNNVDIDVETSYQAETQIKYNAILDSITAEFSRIRAVLNK